MTREELLKIEQEALRMADVNAKDWMLYVCNQSGEEQLSWVILKAYMMGREGKPLTTIDGD